MIKRRNILAIVILWPLTLGLYGLGWFYRTSDELIRHNKQSANPFSWLILALIPFANLFAMWKHAQAVEQMSKSGNGKGVSGALLFLLWFPWIPVVPTIAAVVTQLQLNKRAAAS